MPLAIAAHRVLAHAEVDVAAGAGLAVEVAAALERRLGRVGRGRRRRRSATARASRWRSGPCRRPRGSRASRRPCHVGRSASQPGRQLARLRAVRHSRGEIRERLRLGREAAVPVRPRRFVPRSTAARKCFSASAGTKNASVRLPAERLLRERHLVVAERDCRAPPTVPGLVRRAVADRRADDDDRRPVFLRAAVRDRARRSSSRSVLPSSTRSTCQP